MKSTSSVVVVVVAFCFLGCEQFPVIRDVTVAGDTSSPTGPYEVRATAFSDDGFSSVEVRLDDDTAIPMVAGREAPSALDVRFSAEISGRPLGTVVRFAVVACDGNAFTPFCTFDPPDFPDDAHQFVVGNVPSRPRIESVSPSSGPASGGQVVELRGADFDDVDKVSFGDVTAPHLERVGAELLRVVTPAHAVGAVDVVVVNADGSLALLRSAYTYLPAPEIASVSPGSGPERGGTRITIEGANFPVDARVVVDGVPCRSPAFLSQALLSCETPPGRGIVDVAVLDDVGGGVGRFVDAFTYVPAPRLDAVTPDSGNSEGGQLITIIGGEFQEGAVVVVGGAVCDDVVVFGDSIQCTVPAGEAGVVDVVVVNADGQSGILVGGYAHLGPPVVVAVVPAEGPVTGAGVIVRVLGAGLAVDDAVFFGDARSPLVIDAIDDIELLVELPPSSFPLAPAPESGFVDVDVVVQRTRADDDRSGALDDGFRYLWPPEVDSVTPPEGPTAGGTRVIVNGRFFVASTTLSFDDVPCLDVEFISSTQLACTTPPGEAGLADVAAETDVLVGTGLGVFTYVPPPRVDAIAPAEGPTFGGELVTVTGAFFRPGALVFIDGAPCTNAVVVDAGTITCTTPPGERGRADVAVVNVDGQLDTARGIYNYTGVAVTPDHGLPTGFTRVRVRAAGMQPGVTVRFDGVVAACSFVSAREVICQTPPHPAVGGGSATGLVEVRFRNPDGTNDGDEAFTYTSFGEVAGSADNLERNANHVVIADVDGDGDGDLLVANGRVGTPESSVVFINRAALDFERRDIPGTEVTGNTIDIGSINSDDLPDLVISASNGLGAVLLRSTGPAQWATVELPLSAENSAFDAQLADLLGDGRDDLLVLGIGCDPVLDFEQTPGCDPLSFGVDALFEQTGVNGGSTLSRRDNVVRHEQRQVHDHKMVITDLDGDGDNDIVVVVNNDPYGGENRVLRNRVDEGSGFVKETAALSSLVGDLYDIDAGDIDGDGDNDVVTSLCFGDGAVSSEVVLRNNDGQLAVDATALPASRDDCSIGVKLLDVDDDGDLDVLWSGSSDPRNVPRLLTRLYVNRGDGTFVDGSAFAPQPPRSMQGNNLDGADLDGDGDLDLVLAAGAPYAATDLPGAVLVFEQR